MKYLLCALILMSGTAFADSFDSCSKMASIAEISYKQLHMGKTPEQVAELIPKVLYPVPQTSVTGKDGLIKFVAYIKHHFYFTEMYDTVFAIQLECHAALDN
jgi:hypothetical protein